MSMDYGKYRLITEREDKELFLLQTSLLSLKNIPAAEKTLKLSLLLTQNPILDYETAIYLLHDFSLCESNLNLLIVGAEMNAVWPVIQPNPFIEQLKMIYPQCSDQDKSIIIYLEAIDIDNSNSNYHKKVSKVKQLLKNSLDLCSDYVNNYYRLALHSDKVAAKQLMQKAMSNVVAIKQKDKPVAQNLTFVSYLREYVLGTHINTEQFALLEEYYNSI